MKETQLSSRLTKSLRAAMPGCVVFKHTDMYTSGIPDTSVTWMKRTVWLEVKIARKGRIEGRGVQLQVCRSLAAVGLCLFVIYEFGPDCVGAVDPRKIDDSGEWDTYDFQFFGLDHDAVANRVKLLIKSREER